jgi:hypothetical protein
VELFVNGCNCKSVISVASDYSNSCQDGTNASCSQALCCNDMSVEHMYHVIMTAPDLANFTY